MATTSNILKVRSRHPSHNILRKSVEVPIPTVVRFGSDTVVSDEYFQINSIQGCKNAANKLLMKNCFQEHNVKTADWVFPETQEQLREWLSNRSHKFIIKSLTGSRGRGLYLKENAQGVIDFFADASKFGRYIVERYYNYSKEYRLHVSKDGCFYTCRKMLKTDANERWYRNDSNCVWIMEENPLFDKPDNWNAIEQECVKALKAVGLDLGACDVRVQTKAPDRLENFIICEINSAPSFGEVTAEKYKQQIKNICADYLVTLD